MGLLKADNTAESLAEKMEFLLLTTNGEPEYVGASNSTAMLLNSQDKIKETAAQLSLSDLCEDYRRDVVRKQHERDAEVLKILLRTVTPPTDLDIPGPVTASPYIQAFFNEYYLIYPFLDKRKFMEDCRSIHNLGQKPTREFAVIYLMVLCIGSHRVRQEAPWDTNSVGYHFYAQAQQRLIISTSRTSLAVIQGMILVAQYMEFGGRSQSFWDMLGSMIRMAQTLGLHRKLRPVAPLANSQGGLAAMDLVEIRKRVFWTLYIMDNNSAQYTGRPAAIQDFDCDQDEPALTLDDMDLNQGLTNADGTPFNTFAAQVAFARISHTIQKELYSVEATAKLDTASLTRLITQLDQKLKRWLTSLPAEFQLNYRKANTISNAQYSTIIIPLIQIRYYHSLLTVHRRGPRQDSTSSSGADTKDSQATHWYIAAEAARSMLSIITRPSPRLDDVCLDVTITWPAAAIIFLFTRLLRDLTPSPSSPSTLYFDTAQRTKEGIERDDHVMESIRIAKLDLELLGCVNQDFEYRSGNSRANITRIAVQEFLKKAVYVADHAIRMAELSLSSTYTTNTHELESMVSSTTRSNGLQSDEFEEGEGVMDEEIGMGEYQPLTIEDYDQILMDFENTMASYAT